jgi:type I restriction enzyme S subunit
VVTFTVSQKRPCTRAEPPFSPSFVSQSAKPVINQLQILLPPLEEQRSLVARIEELAGKIEEARSLRRQIIEEYDALCRSIIFANSDEITYTAMQELVKLRDTDVVVSPEEIYNFAGVYSFGRGVFKQQSQSGLEFSYKNLTRLKVGNFVYPKLMAWEGGLGVVPPECDGLVVSPEFPVFEVDENRVLPETLDVYFRTPSVWSLLASVSTGTNIRRRRLHPSNFLKFKMPLPPMKTQQKLREVKRRVDAMKRLRENAIAELDALLPSILDKAFKGELL